ncbi:MAG: nucleotidyl transferase AbiEii/AbiGii toxin family protein [Candidatus Shapirobacteria bacterium]
MSNKVCLKLISFILAKSNIFLLDYGFEERKLKIEITRIKTETSFIVMNYLGISMLVMNRSAMVAGKLLALATRTKLANRDIFDIWYFLKNNWEIDNKVIKSKSGLDIKKIIEMAIRRVEKVKNNQILFGLGDLLSNSTKDFVKKHLKEDVLLELKMRL